MPPLEIAFNKVEEEIEPEEYYAYIIGRENRISDFDGLIKYVCTKKVNLTAKDRLFPKKNLMDYYVMNNYMDVIRNEDKILDDIKNIKDTTVSYGIIKLLESAGVINSIHENVELSYNYNSFIKMNRIEKFRELLHSYLKASSVFINEMPRVQRTDYKVEEYYNLTPARKFILEMIKLLPLDYSWVLGSEFRKMIRMKNHNFLRNETGDFYVKDPYECYEVNYDYLPDFEEYDAGFIDVCLMEYFATIGIIDVIIDTATLKYLDNEFLEVKYIRLTHLGAILLGLINEKEKSEDDNKFIVTDDFEIIIFNGKNKLEYELFFERFFTKVSEEAEKSIYKIDFTGLAKAYDLEIPLYSIIEYIEQRASKYSFDVIKKIKELFCKIEK